MRSYKSQFSLLFLKKALRDIPKILLVFLVVAVITCGAVFGVSKIYGESLAKVQVAYVFEDEEFWFTVGLKNMGRSVNADFIKYDEDDAIEALEDREVVAVIIIENDPDELLNSNFPISSIRFIHYDEEDFINQVFDNAVESAITDFMVLNLDRDVVRMSDVTYSSSDMNELEDDLLKYLMHRNKYYEQKAFYDSGDIPLKEFYEGNAIALIMLLSVSVVLGFGKNDDNDFINFAKRSGISEFDVFIAKYLPISVFYLAVMFVTSIVVQKKVLDEFSFGGFISPLLGMLVILLSIIFIHELISDKLVSTLVAVLYSILSMFLAGNIIPMAFMPAKLLKISKAVPTGYGAKLFGQLFYGKSHLMTMVGAIICILVFAGLIVVLTFVRRKQNESI